MLTQFCQQNHENSHFISHREIITKRTKVRFNFQNSPFCQIFMGQFEKSSVFIIEKTNWRPQLALLSNPSLQETTTKRRIPLLSDFSILLLWLLQETLLTEIEAKNSVSKNQLSNFYISLSYNHTRSNAAIIDSVGKSLWNILSPSICHLHHWPDERYPLY